MLCCTTLGFPGGRRFFRAGRFPGWLEIFPGGEVSRVAGDFSGRGGFPGGRRFSRAGSFPGRPEILPGGEVFQLVGGFTVAEVNHDTHLGPYSSAEVPGCSVQDTFDDTFRRSHRG